MSLPVQATNMHENQQYIEERLAQIPGLCVAGAAYRGVGIPDCIAGGESAAESVVRYLEYSLA